MASGVPRASGGSPAGWWQPRGILVLLATYGLGHAALRLALSPTLNIDDSREAVFAQTLEWGYQARQPPLYDWFVWGAFRLLGVGLPALTLVKYALLCLAYGLLYASARRLLADDRLAALATFSLLLMVPINWAVHADLTHSVAALAAAAASLYALLRLADSGSLPAYLALGLTLGLGLLAKFSYVLFAVALLIAAGTVEGLRHRILSPRMLATLGVAAALVLPYLVWLGGQDVALASLYVQQLRPATDGAYLGGAAAGLSYLGRVTVYYLTPLWLAWLVLFPAAWRPAAPTATLPARRLLERFLLVELALLVLAALAGAYTYLKFRWLMPAFVLVPLYFFSRVDAARTDPARLRRFAGLLLAAELAVVLGLVGDVYRGDRVGRPTRLNLPYDAVAAELAAAGFRGGTIVAGRGAVGGNLRVRFPDSRVLFLEGSEYRPPAHGAGQCLLVWERGNPEVPPELREFLASALGADLGGSGPAHAVEARYRRAVTETFRVHYLLLPDGAGRCR